MVVWSFHWVHRGTYIINSSLRNHRYCDLLYRHPIMALNKPGSGLLSHEFPHVPLRDASFKRCGTRLILLFQAPAFFFQGIFQHPCNVVASGTHVIWILSHFLEILDPLFETSFTCSHVMSALLYLFSKKQDYSLPRAKSANAAAPSSLAAVFLDFGALDTAENSSDLILKL